MCLNCRMNMATEATVKLAVIAGGVNAIMGFAKGYCSGKDIDLNNMIDNVITYGTPAVTTAFGGYMGFEITNFVFEKQNDILKTTKGVAAGAAGFGLVSAASTAAGYGLGYLVSKIA